MEDQNLTREELLEALAKSQAQVNILQKALLEDSKLAKQSRYEEIIQGLTDLVTRWLPDTTATYVNETYCEYFGLSMEQVLGNPFLPNLPEETQRIVKDAIQKMVSGEVESVTTEEESIDADGNHHWIQWTYSPIRDANGEIFEFQSVGRDITDLRQARAELERATAVVNQSPVVMFRRLMVDGRPQDTEYISENVRRYGYHPEDFYSGKMSLDDVIHPDHKIRVGTLLAKHIKDHTDEFEMELLTLSPDNREVWFALQGTFERDENDVPLVHQGVLIDITERKQGEFAREMGMAQTQSLYKMSAKMSMANGLDEILTAVTESVSPVNLNRSYLLDINVDEANKLETVRIIANWGAEGEEQLFPVGTVFPAQLHASFEMFLQREPFMIGDMTTDERLDAATRQILTGNGMRSAVVLSLFDGQKLFGGILMESRDVFEFTGDERQALGMISTQLSSAVQNELLLQTTNARAQALETVAEVATAVTAAQEDPQAVLKQVVDLTKERFGLYHAHVYQMNSAGDTLELVSGAGKIGDQMVAEKRSIPFAAEQSLVARAARSKEGVIVNDVTAAPNFLPHPLLPETKAELAVPMLAGDEVVGVLDVQASGMRRFDQDDVDVLTTLASQAAVALQNAEQYELIQQANEVIEASPVIIYRRKVVDNMLDEILYVSENVSQYGYSAEDLTSGRVPFEQTVYPDDLQFVGETLIGNLQNNIDEYEFEYRGIFPGDRVVWFTLRAKVERDENGEAVLQSGTIIDITDIKKADQEREAALSQTQKLFDVSKKLNEAGDLQEVLTAIVESIESVEFDRAMLVVHDLNKEDYKKIDALNFLATWAGTEEAQAVPLGMKMPAAEFPAVNLMEKREIHLIDNYQTDERFDEALKNWLAEQGVQSGLLMPLFDGDKPLAGVIVESVNTANFSEDEQQLMELVAAQATPVIQNVLQYEEVRRSEELTRSMYQTSQKLNAAGDLQEVLTAVVESIESVEFDRAMLVSHDLNREDYKKIDALNFLATWAGTENAQVVPVGMVMPASEFPAVNLMEKQEIHLINDYQTDERFDDALKKWLSDQGVKSGLLMPLFDGDKPLAGVIVESTKQSNFTKDEQSLMELVASQVTPVVQNVLLLENTARRAQALATVAEVSTAVTATQDPRAVLKQVVDLTKERFGLYHAHVYQMNDAGDTLELVSGAGEIGDQMVSEKRSIPFVAEQSLVARAARSKEGVIVNDVTADPNFLAHPLLPETKAELAVPMLAGEDVVGVLDVQASGMRRFDQDDVDVLTTLASQAAVALQNAEQYEAIQQANEVIERSPVILYRRRIVDNMLEDILFVSENVASYGYTAEDLTSGRVPFEQTVYPDDLQRVGETLIGNLQNNIDEYEFEYRGIFPGDRVVWFSFSGNVERDEDGESVLQTGTLIDITEIKKAELERAAALAQTQKLFDISQKLNAAGDLQEVLTSIAGSIESVEFDRAQMISIDADADNRISALHIIATWGRTDEIQVAPVGMTLAGEVFPAVDIFENSDVFLINEYVTEESFDERTKEWLAEAGMRSGMFMPLFEGNKPIAGIVMESMKTANFTENEKRLMELAATQLVAVVQKNLQFEDVRRSETLVRDIINATPDWIFVKDLDHRYVMANKGYGDSLHIAPEDFIGKNDIELGFPEELVKGDPERGIRGFWADDDQVFETKEALLIERDIVQVDGKERIYSTLKTPLTDAAGNVSSVLIFARDVTEREDLLQETRSRAEQEALINTISQKIQSTTSVESALQVAIRELGDSLGAEKTSIRLGVDAGQRKRNK